MTRLLSCLLLLALCGSANESRAEGTKTFYGISSLQDLYSKPCWSYHYFYTGRTGVGATWAGGNGPCSNNPAYATPPRYSVQVTAETIGTSYTTGAGMPWIMSGRTDYGLTMWQGIPAFFSYEKRQQNADSLTPPYSNYRMIPGLFNFDFVPDGSGKYAFQSVIDKVNANYSGFPSQYKANVLGTSLVNFLNEDFEQNSNATNGTLPMPSLKNLHVELELALNDYSKTTVTSYGRRCASQSNIIPANSQNDGGTCNNIILGPNGTGNGRVSFSIAVYSPDIQKTYWLEFVTWIDGPNLFESFPATNRFVFPYQDGDIFTKGGYVMEYGPGNPNWDQIYINADAMTPNRSFSSKLPACPALTYGSQNMAPDGNYRAYGIDVAGLMKCIPWNNSISTAQVDNAQLKGIWVGTVVNGQARVYWKTDAIMAFTLQ